MSQSGVLIAEGLVEDVGTVLVDLLRHHLLELLLRHHGHNLLNR